MFGPAAPRARNVIADFAARGHYHFSSSELRSVLGVSEAAARQALSRLAAKGEIASPARGFYVIVPPEYRRLGCLPADQFIPALMEHRSIRYYVGLLSAAQYHGAAHHRPQEFQVVLQRNRPAIVCGAVRVAFVARRDLDAVPVESVNNPRGTILVSTVEATAIDLVGYMHRAGGVDRVAGVLLELGDEIDPKRLVEASQSASILWAQRLGYLLEHVGAGDSAVLLKEHVREHARNFTRLLPWRGCRGGAAVEGLAAVGERKHRDGSVIPRDYISEWRERAPWSEDFQVEQDLVISRALVAVYSDPVLAQALAFRGGTALYKLYLTPPARYSEDIDLVQVEPGPAGPLMDRLRSALDPWLGKARWKQSQGRVTFGYRFLSEDVPAMRLRLKVGINTREHFAVLGFTKRTFSVESRWYSGAGRYRDLRTRRAAGNKAESALSAPQGPRPVRPGDGAGGRAERCRADRGFVPSVHGA